MPSDGQIMIQFACTQQAAASQKGQRELVFHLAPDGFYFIARQHHSKLVKALRKFIEAESSIAIQIELAEGLLEIFCARYDRAVEGLTLALACNLLCCTLDSWARAALLADLACD